MLTLKLQGHKQTRQLPNSKAKAARAQDPIVVIVGLIHLMKRRTALANKANHTRMVSNSEHSKARVTITSIRTQDMFTTATEVAEVVNSKGVRQRPETDLKAIHALIVAELATWHAIAKNL